jgi:hypothetical protein
MPAMCFAWDLGACLIDIQKWKWMEYCNRICSEISHLAFEGVGNVSYEVQ